MDDFCNQVQTDTTKNSVINGSKALSGCLNFTRSTKKILVIPITVVPCQNHLTIIKQFTFEHLLYSRCWYEIN